MRERKSKKEKSAAPAFLSYAYIIAWIVYILRLFSEYRVTTQPVKPQLPDNKQAKKVASKEKIKKKESHEHMQEKLVHRNEEAPRPPLQTFSTKPNAQVVALLKRSDEEKQSKKDGKGKKSPAAVPASNKVVKASSPKSSSVAKGGMMKPVDKKPIWLQLKICVSNTRKLIGEHVYDHAQKPMYQLINNLAFLYRYHLLNLALRGLMVEGDSNKSKLESIRAVLVHGADYHLFDPELMRNTQESIAQLNLNELNTIGQEQLGKKKTKLEGSEIGQQMLQIPMYEHMANIDKKDLPAIKKEKIDNWIKNEAIPVLNAISQIHDQSINDKQRETCNHALKMLIIMVGEYGPKRGKFDEDKFSVSESSDFKAFMSDCNQMRNFYAHFCLVDSQEQNFNKLIYTARKINDKSVAFDYDDVNDLLSPHAAKKKVKSRCAPGPSRVKNL